MKLNVPSASISLLARALMLALPGVFLLIVSRHAQAQGKYARPDSTQATGGWTPAVDPHLNIDEVTAIDTDYVERNTNTGTLIVGLSNIANPPSGNHILRFRVQGVGSNPVERVDVALYQGATLITSRNEIATRPGWTTYSYTLSSAEVGLLNDYTDYTDLWLYFTPDPGNGAAETVRVSWAEFFVQEPISSGTNYRSIGTNCGTIYNLGTATVPNNGTVVTFAAGAALPGSDLVGAVGVGDRIIFEPGTASQETRYILSRDLLNQVTLQNPVSSAHTATPYVIRRAFCSLQEWEDLRQGNLVTDNRVEVGVAYKDGPFSEAVVIGGSVADAAHYMRLTVASGQRHNGTAASGVRNNVAGLSGNGFSIVDNFTVLEWFVVTGAGTLGPPIGHDHVQVNASSVQVSNVISDGPADDNMSVGAGSATFRNCIGLNAGDQGISSVTGAVATAENCTIYNAADTGVGPYVPAPGTIIATNVISVDAIIGADFGAGVSGDYNVDSDGSAPGVNSFHNSSAANLFQNSTAGDFHLRAGADAMDNGTDLSPSFSGDVDGDVRSVANNPWDRGADEAGPVNVRSIGSYSTGGYSAGVATVSGGTTVNFAAGGAGEPVPNIPAWVVGHPIVLEPGTANQEERIATWVSSTQVTVSLAFSLGHTNVAYDLGNARITSGSTTVTFGADTSLPTWIVPNFDQFTVDPGTASQEVFTIVSRDTPTQLTVSAAATLNHYNRPYTVTRRYDTGNASIPAGGTTVTFGGGASLPTWVGVGDRLDFAGETLYIRSRDSATQATVQTAATAPHSGAYSITRAYARLQDWEDARQGNLVAEHRSEVGVAYNDGPFHTRPRLPPVLFINGSTTDQRHYMRLTVAPGHRHQGVPGSNVLVDCRDAANANVTGAVSGIDVRDDYTQVEWFEITRCTNRNGTHGAQARDASQVLLQNLLVHDFEDGPSFSASGIQGADNSEVTVRNSIVYDGDRGIRGDPGTGTGAVTVENCTVYGMSGAGVWESATDGVFTVKNTISMGTSGDFLIVNGTQENNLSSDTTAQPVANQGKNPLLEFVNTTAGLENLHLAGTAWSINNGSDLSARFNRDIDDALRPVGAGWDIGADEFGATTAVGLVSFAATALDGEALLEWETGSEINNLGFHLYRASSEEGPYDRITTSVIPGLGSSPEGARYRYVDAGLVNGVTYHYKLEDIETTGKTELHGPVSATPQAGAGSSTGGDGATEGGGETSSLITYGDPSANRFEVMNASETEAVLELTTEGFYAEPLEDGTVRLSIPGFEPLSEPGLPSLPVKRPWVEALAGLGVNLVSIEEQSVVPFTSLVPSGASEAVAVGSRVGTVRLELRQPLRVNPGSALMYNLLYPREAARILGTGFQGEVKKVQVELAPLRWDGGEGRLLLARRLLVRLRFEGRARQETPLGGARGRLYRFWASHGRRSVVARLATKERGLHVVRYEEVLRGRGSEPASGLRLSRLGEPVAFHIEPETRGFGPGSRLYFLSEGPEVNPYGDETVYELELRPRREPMAVGEASPVGEPTSHYWRRLEQEVNRYYQAALLKADDLWLWDVLMAPVKKRYAFDVPGLASTGEASRLLVGLEGASDFEASPDHHVRVYLNGALVRETSWEGKTPQKVEAELFPGQLLEGENFLELENVGDTGASYSMVFLDRFTVDYPRILGAEAGRLEGSFNTSGVAEVSGVGSSGYAVDVTEEERPVWLRGVESTGEGAVRFRADAGRKYLVVGAEYLGRPEVRRPGASYLKRRENRADYLVIGPAAFLDEARPLLELRRSEGLRVKAVSVEQVYEEFGFGEGRPEALGEFLAYAYHRWTAPSVRYVLLVGDGSYDFKDYLGTGVENQVPPLLIKTSYLWTASDPTLATVNGEDLLPDIAVGRLPAANEAELRVMVEKIVAYESGAAEHSGPLVLVADNPDLAGDFVANAETIASGVLAGRTVEKLYLSELGPSGTRSEIVKAFDEGASLMSYIGHGGIYLWANENVFNAEDVASLAPQSQQPLFVTMNCLNGYFHFPYFNSLGEEVVKVGGKGAIAAFSPSGLSLNDPAHVFHNALLDEVFNQGHERLGDAVLAAQADYAASGAFPELLSIYHLLGDPALRLR